MVENIRVSGLKLGYAGHFLAGRKDLRKENLSSGVVVFQGWSDRSEI
jgi:hypothetical protein